MSKIYIQPPNYDSFDKFLEYAKEYDYNLEIASFAYSNLLDTNWQKILKDHQQKLHDFKGIISLHGAFQDLIIHSRDNKIREVAKDRIFQNLDIAKVLNAKYVVFHGNFNPLITHESYKQNWIEQNVSFWSKVLDKYQIVVLLENLWESRPDIYRKLLDRVNSSRLKICFDMGHANIFSKAPLEEWIAVLREGIVYMHVNDNEGDIDNELVPGEGNINWHEYSDQIEKYQIAPGIVFEVGTLEKTIQSLKYFREKNIYPLNVYGSN
ncbi:MAG: sugar phosphate isomerase/epimerase family protein [Candidatus Methanofastidiosia archaeon]